ncbi:MAG: fructosamine kinase [Flavobacteriales bacterium]|nr:fructosamine kinase [Flavobacteriales bacterium]|tara:strand:- start:10506 stop:11432 length:927 start_codon:yes stop_codon:yes gene_type:complete
MIKLKLKNNPFYQKTTILNFKRMLSNKDIHIIEQNTKTEIIDQESLSGGDINNLYLLKTTTLPLVVKSNSLEAYPDMFKYEKKGLEKLKQTKSIEIVDTIDQINSNETSFLILNYIKTEPETNQLWENFGIQLNKLHQTKSNSFGLDTPNYIGSIPQVNKWCATWSEFYVTQRLELQLKTAVEKGHLKGMIKQFEKLYHQLDELFPEEPASLIHGDLWRGNFISGENSTPWLIDPAIYFGHREMDIGMTLLFGGFDINFYRAYNSENPLEKDWEERVPLTQLYPLLVHVNLFGGQYEASVKSILNRFV